MGQRIALTLIGIFLISLIPASDIQFTDTEDTIERLEPMVKRVEIPSDPDSIQDLGSPKVSHGYERIRENFADSSIGIFTQHGLIPSVHLSKSLFDQSIYVQLYQSIDLALCYIVERKFFF